MKVERRAKLEWGEELVTSFREYDFKVQTFKTQWDQYRISRSGLKTQATIMAQFRAFFFAKFGLFYFFNFSEHLFMFISIVKESKNV